jgi:hypothetical protein
MGWTEFMTVSGVPLNIRVYALLEGYSMFLYPLSRPNATHSTPPSQISVTLLLPRSLPFIPNVSSTIALA